MKVTLNSRLFVLMLGLMLLLVACEKSEISSSASQEAIQINNIPLQLTQVTSFLENMDIDVSSKPSTTASRKGDNLVEASYIIPDFNTARASNGETFGIAGSGDLTRHPKSVCGGGDWVHYDSNDDEIASGSWEAEQLLSFSDYGPSPVFPPEEQFVHAGKAIIRIHLGAPADVDAILTVYCILPEVQTPASWPEGIKINIQEGGPNFNQVIPGGTFYAIPWFPVCE